jgi:hypothetical protein
MLKIGALKAIFTNAVTMPYKIVINCFRRKHFPVKFE